MLCGEFLAELPLQESVGTVRKGIKMEEAESAEGRRKEVEWIGKKGSRMGEGLNCFQNHGILAETERYRGRCRRVLLTQYQREAGSRAWALHGQTTKAHQRQELMLEQLIDKMLVISASPNEAIT